jgi:serine protease Do
MPCALTAFALAGALGASAPAAHAGRVGAAALPHRQASVRSDLPDLATVAQSALPSVVGVLTVQADDDPAGDPLKEFVQRFRGEGGRKGIASGFIIHPDGLILTNAHVIEGATRIEVEVGDGDERFVARQVGSDEASDVALLKIDAGRPLPALPLGDSDRLRIAEWVLVVGNPFGLAHSVTAGIVSHTGRSDIAPIGHDGYFDFIQTDAPINPGNSGGPLLNVRGEVVGMATAINASGQGIGFALPINMAKEIIGQLRDHGRVIRSWLGVSVRELKTGRAHEVQVTKVHAGSPAAAGGVMPGDVITGFEGRRVASAARLRWSVSTAGVGRDVSVTVRRGAGVRSLRVHLGELPKQ